jgi:hypothetical protein
MKLHPQRGEQLPDLPLELDADFRRPIAIGASIVDERVPGIVEKPLRVGTERGQRQVSPPDQQFEAGYRDQQVDVIVSRHGLPRSGTCNLALAARMSTWPPVSPERAEAIRQGVG